ncbi:hypothetical protein BDV25DRAFT_143384 [Aspergillus avenaceus]|uniref:Uncharacterized protein n=1 Tax=Aspergillus avenaceus TaxID=36643 RepID=A0A5N6TKA4_ASPAV|nr:hypothetical protein BDV25DRAFT_143384 [Aspergillus avenaceus]
MKPIYILTLLAPTIYARACTQYLLYCGSTLKTIDTGYDSIIRTKLQQRGIEVTDHSVEDSWWYCLDFGDINYIDTCEKCVNAGSGNDDHC